MSCDILGKQIYSTYVPNINLFRPVDSEKICCDRQTREWSYKISVFYSSVFKPLKYCKITKVKIVYAKQLTKK